jgi:hypothetical protein
MTMTHHATTFLVTVGVRFDAAGYEDAGKVLDAIDAAVALTLAGRESQHELAGLHPVPRAATSHGYGREDFGNGAPVAATQ